MRMTQQNTAGRPGIDSFQPVMMREDCDIEFIVSFDDTSDAMTEIGGFSKRIGKIIRAGTVLDILDKGIASVPLSPTLEFGLRLGVSL